MTGAQFFPSTASGLTVENTRATATVTAGEGTTPLASIPYEPGRIALTDGQMVSPQTAFDALLCLLLEASDHACISPHGARRLYCSRLSAHFSSAAAETHKIHG